MIEDKLKEELKSEKWRWKHAQISRDIGVNKTTISRFVNGKNGITLKNAEKMIDTLGLKVKIS